MQRPQKTAQVGCPCEGMLETESNRGACSIVLTETDRRDGAEDLLERILERNNLNKAYLKVKRNGGSAGVDGMTVNEMLPYLKENREELLTALRNGWYKPQAVRSVEIPKPDGGVRKLGVPTVIDRMIQQAIVQVGYYSIADMESHIKRLNEWIRRRIRQIYWKQWKKIKSKHDNLVRLGINNFKAWEWANSRKAYWRIADSFVLHRSLTNEYLASVGYDDILNRYKVLHSNY